jgi:hypothetical protein
MITDETSPAYQKEFNGMAERHYQSIKGTAITMLTHSGLSRSYTRFALGYALFVKNRLRHPTEKTTTPFEMWNKRKPDLRKLYPFGCRVTVHIPKEKRKDYYSERGSSGIFLGYNGETHIIVYLPDQRRIINTHDAIFHATKFGKGMKFLDVTSDGSSEDSSDESEGEVQAGAAAPTHIPHELLPRPVLGEDKGSAQRRLRSHQNKTTRDDNDYSGMPDLSESSDEDDLPVKRRPVPDEETPDTDSDTEKGYTPLTGENYTPTLDDMLGTSDPEDLVIDIYPDPDDLIILSEQTGAQLNSWNIDKVCVAKVKKTAIPSRNPTPSPIKKTPKYPNPNNVPPPGTIKVEGLGKPPKTREAMLRHRFREYFIGAEEVELNAMDEKEAWRLRHRMNGRKLLRPKWIYSYKIDHNTQTVLKFKARLCAMGHMQTAKVDYDQSFSPVIRVTTLRIMLVIALLNNFIIEQADVDTAYLNAKLDIPNYMMMPEGYQETAPDGRAFILELLRSLYGLHQSGREWNKLITATFLEAGFTQSKCDPCLFHKYDESKRSFVLIYVDDLVIMALTQGEVEDIKNILKEKFTITELGAVQHLLGLQVEKVNGGIYLGQPHYVAQILEDLDMSECSVSPTPMQVGWEHDDKSSLLSPTLGKIYHSTVMKAAYLANQTRPDISFTVNTLSQFQKNCNEHDWKALMRLLRYLRGTQDYGLFYSKDNNPLATLHSNDDLDGHDWYTPVALADASHAQEVGRKSRSAHIIMMAGAAACWLSKKQPVVAISSTEAEYYSLSEAVKEVLWVRQIYEDVGVELRHPTVVHQDNQSTIAIALNPIQHQRVKHMDVRVHFLRDHLDKEDITLAWCPTEDMIADVLTKALPGAQHRKFTELMGLRSLEVLRGTRGVPHGKEYYFDTN